MRSAFLRVAVLCMAALGIQSHSWAAADAPPPPNTMLLVDAKPEPMAAFERALRQLIPKRYDRYGLGCTVDYDDGDGEEGCNVMRRGNPVPEDLEFLVYYFNDKNTSLLTKFEQAREKVKRQFPSEKSIFMMLCTNFKNGHFRVCWN